MPKAEFSFTEADAEAAVEDATVDATFDATDTAPYYWTTFDTIQDRSSNPHSVYAETRSVVYNATEWTTSAETREALEEAANAKA